MRQLDFHGLFILLIAKAEAQTRIFDVATCFVKPPTGNNTGNKGAVMVRFGFEDSSFVFVNCHLAGGSHSRNVEERHEQISYLFREGFNAERGTQYQSY